MNRKIVPTAAILLITATLTACSGITTLTPDLLSRAETKWNASKPQSYRLVIEMKGDRVPQERFEVSVQAGHVASLSRNGLEITPSADQDYSMDGLFKMLEQEMTLVQKPSLLGAPEGYSAYPMARFDDQSGRLIQYRRTVGGTSNTIDIRVTEFNPG